MLRIINILTYALITLIVALQTNCFGQDSKNESKKSSDNIYMTWNKNTPESEMNDDIRALAEKGITITYSDVKRNDKNEITAIKVAYSDQNGNKGAMELNNQKPINTIKFYKQGDEVGFGNPSNAMVFAGGDFFDGNGQDYIKRFNFGNGGGAQSFTYAFPEGMPFGDSSKIIIKKDGKKTLIIKDGEVIEGGDDYTKEELEDIKKNNKVHVYGFGSNFINSEDFDFGDLEGLEELKKLNIDLDGLNAEGQRGLSKEELDRTKEEMIKAKEEMIKAKKEMEKAKKDLQKAKSSLKTQKA